MRIFTTVLALLILLATTVHAQTSRATTAASYLDRGNAWAAKGEWVRALADDELAIASGPNIADS